MPLELLGVPKQLFVVEELEEALVELSDVVPPVFRELYHHHDQVELPDGDEVRHDEGQGVREKARVFETLNFLEKG